MYLKPKSLCHCGHTGDGPYSDHLGNGPQAGHGACLKCDCVKFLWSKFLWGYVLHRKRKLQKKP
jgi:hypothetical protein